MASPKILYVEDELFLARIVSETLASKGYDVIHEANGSKAFERFLETQPDVCLLDVMLPGKDGFEIADLIREKDKQVPIIFLTAKSSVDDVVNGFKTGAHDYIRKPFSMEELIVRIENVLRLKGGVEETAEEIKMGAYTFNAIRQVLRHPDEERKLSYRETELLQTLYRNRNQIVERRSILTLLWGSDSFFNSRTLDVYITKLRTYLKLDPSVQIITIKGVGYRFVVN